MGFDPGGIPLRLRSHLATLPPARKSRLEALRDRVVRPAGGVAQAGPAWLDRLAGVDRAELRVLMAGPFPAPAAWAGRVERLDPAGRGSDLRVLGGLDPGLLDDGAFDLVVVADPAPAGPAALWRDATTGLEVAWRAVRPGGRLAVLVDATDAGAVDAWCARAAGVAAVDRQDAGEGVVGFVVDKADAP